MYNKAVASWYGMTTIFTHPPEDLKKKNVVYSYWLLERTRNSQRAKRAGPARWGMETDETWHVVRIRVANFFVIND